MTTDTNKTTICFIAFLCASLALAGALAYASNDQSGNGDVADCLQQDAIELNAMEMHYESDDEFWYGKLQYRILENGTCTVIDYRQSPGDVIVPDKVPYKGNEFLVTEIAEYGLTTKSIFGTMPKSVEIGPNIVKIGKKAMSANANVHDGYWSFTIREIEHSQLREIGEYAFEDAKIKFIALPASIKTIASNAFYKCKDLRTFAVFDDENTAFTIGWHAFKGCEKLTVADLEKATDIAGGAFLSTDLLMADLSSAVHVASDAFDSVYSLHCIVIGPNLSDDFKLFQKNGKHPYVFHDAEGNVLDSGNLIAGKYKVRDYTSLDFYLVAE